METSRTLLALRSTESTIRINHIDFVMELPEYDGYGTIMMCIDQFNKIVVLVPLCKTDV